MVVTPLKKIVHKTFISNVLRIKSFINVLCTLKKKCFSGFVTLEKNTQGPGKMIKFPVNSCVKEEFCNMIIMYNLYILAFCPNICVYNRWRILKKRLPHQKKKQHTVHFRKLRKKVAFNLYTMSVQNVIISHIAYLLNVITIFFNERSYEIQL